MTKEEMLQQLSDEDLRYELRRRNAERRKAREGVARCRNCQYYGTIDYWGKAPTNGKTQCCPYKKIKSGKHYRVLNPSELACVHYKKKDAEGCAIRTK